MGRLRDHWLEALSTCVTVVLVGVVYMVLAGYAAGPPFGSHRVAALQGSLQTSQSAGREARR